MMDDLKEVKPEYISCVAVDYWRKEWKELPYAVMALSPNKIERIDDQPGNSRVSEVLKPENVSVADAMVTSAAVMTLSPEQEEPYRDLQVERIDDQPGNSRVSEVLKPENVSVADAMVTSAAVMTLSPEQEESYRDLQVQLGLTLRKGFSAEEGGIASKVGGTESEFTFLRKLTYYNK